MDERQGDAPWLLLLSRSIRFSRPIVTDIRLFKEQFDPHLLRAAEARIATALTRATFPGIPELLAHVVTLLREGKRLRPYLVYVGYGGTGELSGDLLSACIGYELFHSFALIHDDVIDEDVERRGIATLHVEARKIRHDVHIANSLAILVGDMLFSWSRDFLALARAQKVIDEMVDEVCLGQIIDVLIAGRAQVSLPEIDLMMELKTARYSFIRPLQLGAVLRGAASDELAFYERFGRAAGLAFQIQDDSFDRTVDAERDVPTYFTRAPEGEAIEHMNALFDEATGMLPEAPITEAQKDALHSFIRMMRVRIS